jgi:hypothetical protein
MGQAGLPVFDLGCCYVIAQPVMDFTRIRTAIRFTAITSTQSRKSCFRFIEAINLAVGLPLFFFVLAIFLCLSFSIASSEQKAYFLLFILSDNRAEHLNDIDVLSLKSPSLVLRSFLIQNLPKREIRRSSPFSRVVLMASSRVSTILADFFLEYPISATLLTKSAFLSVMVSNDTLCAHFQFLTLHFSGRASFHSQVFRRLMHLICKACANEATKLLAIPTY